MDLFYGSWSTRKKAWFDSFTVLLLIVYLGVLLYGGIGSTAYSLGYWGDEPLSYFGELIDAFFTGGPEAAGEVVGRTERSPTAWRPFLWPIKTLMCIGIFLMLLQAVSKLFKGIASIKGYSWGRPADVA